MYLLGDDDGGWLFLATFQFSLTSHAYRPDLNSTISLRYYDVRCRRSLCFNHRHLSFLKSRSEMQFLKEANRVEVRTLTSSASCFIPSIFDLSKSSSSRSNVSLFSSLFTSSRSSLSLTKGPYVRNEDYSTHGILPLG